MWGGGGCDKTGWGPSGCQAEGGREWRSEEWCGVVVWVEKSDKGTGRVARQPDKHHHSLDTSTTSSPRHPSPHPAGLG